MTRLFLTLLCGLYLFLSSSFADEDTTCSKVILVTGASRGIGWETTKKLASEGHQVLASMRMPKSPDALMPDNIKILPLDVTSEKSIEEALSSL